MLFLEKKYLLFNNKYLSQILKNIVFFEKTTRYSYKQNSLSVEHKLILLKYLNTSSFIFFENKSIVKFISNFNILEENFFFPLKKKIYNRNQLTNIKNFIKKKKKY